MPMNLLLRLRPPPRMIALTALATLTMWLGQGCARPDNHRVTVGGEALPSLTAGPHGQAPSGEGAHGHSAADRAGWPVERIVVALDGTEHHPHLTASQPAYDRSHRARGRHPTALTALETGGEPGPIVWEGVAAPFHAATDVLLFIPRLLAAPPRGIATSPVDSYERFTRGPAERGPALEPAVLPIGETGNGR